MCEGDGWYTFKACTDGASLLTIDLGQTMPIRFGVEVGDSDNVSLVEIYYAENLDDAGLPVCNSGLGRYDEGAADSFIPAPGASGFFDTFGIRGCRFVTVVAYLKSDASIRLTPRNVHYPMQRLEFQSSDETINAFWEKSHRTLSTCMLDTYVDCCTREQALWIFDACIQGIAAFYTYGDTELLRQSLRVTGDGVLPGGLIRNVGPMMPSFMIMVDQILEWIQTCFDYALFSGDIEFLSEIESPAYAFLEMCLGNITPEGLFIPPPGTWHWNDWANLDRRPYSLLINARVFSAACSGQKIAQMCGSVRLDSVSSRIRAILKGGLPRFYSAVEGAFLEHIDVGPGIENPRADEDLYPLAFPAGFEVDIQSPCSIHSNAVMLIQPLARPGTLLGKDSRRGTWSFLSQGWNGISTPSTSSAPAGSRRS